VTVEPVTTFRRELLVALSVLVSAAILISAMALAVVFPRLNSPAQDLFFIAGLIAINLAVVIGFGRRFLHRTFVQPVERMLRDAGRIAGGDLRHRIQRMPSAEFEQIRTSVNALADRLVEDQERLAENVRSLDQTNAELVATRDELIRVARLASVGTLASGIAHEVGNPLGALVGFADLARMRAEREGRDTEMLQAIRVEADRIDRIVRTLLEFGRDRSATDSKTEPVHVQSIVGKVRELLESQGRLTDIDLRCGVDSDVPPVAGRAQHVEQILLNLTLNALDAMEETEGPRLEIGLSVEPGGYRQGPRRREDDPDSVDYTHLRRVATDSRAAGPDALHTADRIVVLSVRDNGPGIAPDQASRLFDPFYTTKHPGKGTGMGLAICARLADGMGGRIDLESQPEGGALFKVRLPAQSHAEGAESQS